METKELPNIYFFIDTCAKIQTLMRSFEAAVDLFIAADHEQIPGWERKARITNVMTYQIFRELANTTEPGMARLSRLAMSLLQRPEFNLVVETPVCRRFLSRLHENCIKPHIIDAVLADNPKLCEQLLVEAERLREIAKNGGTNNLKPIQLFDAKGLIRDSYVVQALRSSFGEGKKPLWDKIINTLELKFARKDAGEFSILSALTHHKLEKPYSAVIVTRDDGGRKLFQDAYAGNLKPHYDSILATRRKHPQAKSLQDEDILPYDLPKLITSNSSRLPDAHILSERAFADFLLSVQAKADRVFSKKEPWGRKWRYQYPDTYEKLEIFREVNQEMIKQLNGSMEGKKNINESLVGGAPFRVEDIAIIPGSEIATDKFSLGALYKRNGKHK